MLTEVSVEMVAEIVKSVFLTMMDLEVVPSEVPSIPTGERLTSFVQLTGEWNGAVMFECTRHQACQLAGRILGMDAPEAVDDDVRDMLGELANMIAGNLKCTLAPGIRVSIPSVTDGTDYSLRVCGARLVCRAGFHSESGPFWISLINVDETN